MRNRKPKRIVITVGARSNGSWMRSKLRTRTQAGPLPATILLTERGQSWTSDGFRTSWREACTKAGIADLTFHDLRGTVVTRLAIAGASVQQIATITGHSLKDVEPILDTHYLNRNFGIEETAISKLEKRGKM
ncbi:tyrosine-type recombinase/integrase [Sphingomonas sp. M6A6_1c]